MDSDDHHMRPCKTNHPLPSETADKCRLCWLYTNDEKYRNYWGIEDAPNGITTSIVSCAKRGVWEWVVRDCGRVIASGMETSLQDAEREIETIKATL